MPGNPTLAYLAGREATVYIMDGHYYDQGVMSVAHGDTKVYGSGTAWLTAGVRKGMIFTTTGQVQWYVLRSVDGEEELTLAQPFNQASEVDGDYAILGSQQLILPYYNMDFEAQAGPPKPDIWAVREQGYLVRDPVTGYVRLKRGEDPDPWYNLSFSALLEYGKGDYVVEALLCGNPGIPDWDEDGISSRPRWPFLYAEDGHKCVLIVMLWEDPASCYCHARIYGEVDFTPPDIVLDDAVTGTAISASGRVIKTTDTGISHLYVNVPPNAPENPQCEGETNPQCVLTQTPEFSWTFSDDNMPKPSCHPSPFPPMLEYQTAYQILVASTLEKLNADDGDMWDSGKVISGDEFATYGGSTLAWGGLYYWKVTTWDHKDRVGPYCLPQSFKLNAQPEALNPKCDLQDSPALIFSLEPQFSWTFYDEWCPGDTQSAYQILVASTEENLDAGIGDMWDSGKVLSSDWDFSDTSAWGYAAWGVMAWGRPHGIAYAGAPLEVGCVEGGMTYYWKVRVWDNHDLAGEWSPNQQFSLPSATSAWGYAAWGWMAWGCAPEV